MIELNDGYYIDGIDVNDAADIDVVLVDSSVYHEHADVIDDAVDLLNVTLCILNNGRLNTRDYDKVAEKEVLYLVFGRVNSNNVERVLDRLEDTDAYSISWARILY